MMGVAIQLDLFQEYDETFGLRQEVVSLKESLDKTRKRLFAQDNDLAKLIVMQQSEIHAMSCRIEELKRLVEKANG